MTNQKNLQGTAIVVALLILACALTVLAADTPPTNINAYLLPNGLLDVGALRAAGYSGGLDFPGYRLAPTSDRASLTSPGDPSAVAKSTGYWTGDFPDPGTPYIQDACVWNGDLVIVSNNEAYRWTGNAWQPLGAQASQIYCVGTLGTDLVIGGSFTVVGGKVANRIARFDGNQWSSLGYGLDDDVDVLGNYGGHLVAAGDFEVAGNVYARRIALWNGSDWQPLGSGLNDEIYDLTEFNGQLVAAGYFTAAGTTIVNHIAAWDGGTWHALQNGTDGGIASIAVHDGKLVAAGYFSLAGLTANDGVAIWDGTSWSPLGEFIGDGYYDDLLADIGGSLFLFRYSASGQPEVLTLEDGSWVPVPGTTGFYCAAMLGFNNQLTLCGQDANNNLPTVITFDGSNWTTFAGPGLMGQVLASAMWDGSLVIAGDFTQAGDVAAQGLASWNGSSWTSLCNSLDAGANQGEIQAITEYGGDLIVGGFFDSINGIPAVNVARWDGSSWSALGDGLGNLDNGESVHSLLASGDLLFAGGEFTTSGAAPFSSLASWDGSQWTDRAVGAGARVYDLAEYGSDIAVGGYYVGGYGGIAILHVENNDYYTQGGGIFGTVKHMTSYNGSLVTSGSFYSFNWSGDGILRLNATAWEPLFPEDHEYRQFMNMEVYNDRLYVCGQFSSLESLVTGSIAAYDSTGWDNLDSGVANDDYDGPCIYTLTTTPWGLAAGGRFDTAGGWPSHNMGLWIDQPTGSPVLPPETTSLVLRQNTPNPFNPATIIRFVVPQAGQGSLRIFDLHGALVKTLREGVFASGTGEVRWDGTDGNGRSVSAGMYLYRLSVGRMVLTRRMMLVK